MISHVVVGITDFARSLGHCEKLAKIGHEPVRVLLAQLGDRVKARRSPTGDALSGD
jgi:hypothetical protein